MGWILNFKPSSRFPVHTRGNVSEVFPDPITPLNATTGFLANFEDGYRDAFVEAGVWDDSLYEGEVRFALLGCLGGFVYINMSYLRVFAVRVPGHSPELLDMSYGVDSEAAPYSAEAQPWHIDPERTEAIQEWIHTEVFGATSLPVFDAERDEVRELRAARPDLRTLTDAELVSRVREMNGLLRRLFRSHSEASLKAGFALGIVVAAATEAGMPELAFDVVSGVEKVDSTGPTVLLAELARTVRESGDLSRAFDEGVDGLLGRLEALGSDDRSFLTQFRKSVVGEWGFRGPGEWELRRDTWEIRPELALALIDRMRRPGGEADPIRRMGETRRRRDEAHKKLVANLDRDACASLESGTQAARLWVRARERSRTTSAMALHEQRMAAHELGRRGAGAGTLEQPLQIYMLLAEELEDWLIDPSTFKDVLVERERTYLELFDLVPPFMVTGEVPDHSTWRRRSDQEPPEPLADPVLQGASGSPGSVTGRARIVNSATEVDELEPGDVLVASITDPSWTPLFLTSSAVVTEVGGVFSHGPIVCRELGTPCVVAVEDACRRIPDGALIQVDGTAGTVTILEG